MAENYRAQAEKCRSLARRMTDDRAIDALLKLADEYDARAEAERAAGTEGSARAAMKGRVQAKATSRCQGRNDDAQQRLPPEVWYPGRGRWPNFRLIRSLLQPGPGPCVCQFRPARLMKVVPVVRPSWRSAASP